MTPGGALLLALWLQGAAGAPPAPTARARLELSGGGDCLSRGELASRVSARTPRVRFADDAPIDARVALTSARPGSVVAELMLAPAGTEQPPRRFVARSCGEAADAIAVVIAVTLDPTLKLNQTGADAAGDVPAGTQANDHAAPPGRTTEPSPQRTATPPSTTLETAGVPGQLPGPATPRHFAVQAAGHAIFGPAPALMRGIAVSGMAALDREGLWAPALFIGVTHAWRGELSEPGGAASFTLDAATVDACPLRSSGWRVVARPCASALVGRLAASGSDTEHGASAARPFAAAGLALVAGFGDRVLVSARVGVGVTLLRDSYELGGVTFHRAGAITTAVSLGVGLGRP